MGLRNRTTTKGTGGYYLRGSGKQEKSGDVLYRYLRDRLRRIKRRRRGGKEWGMVDEFPLASDRLQNELCSSTERGPGNKLKPLVKRSPKKDALN